MDHQLNIILVPHTHWDREWYLTFQQFRARLVHTIDSLLDIMDRDPGYSHFMLDGQTIVLDDYLEVQPEQEERLRRAIRSGQILVGPWYLQPDEFLVSGESLIRNLQIGLKQAAEYGNPMHVGYLPDCFGHIAQMPQILRGFGIESTVFWRGVGAEARESEFYWTAPDGSRVLVIHLADGYGNARQMPLVPEEFATRVELLTVPLLPKATTDTLLFMNGSDHLPPQDGLPAAMATVNGLLSQINPEHEAILERYNHIGLKGKDHYQSIQLRIGTLPEYIEVVRQQLAREDGLRTLSGEMRDSQYAHLLPSVLSTRMWIKQQNAISEHLLECWVEPLTAWAWKLGAPYPQGFVRLAWKYLLQNHPHDSICGCSIDQVHRENSARFAQSQQVSEDVITRALTDIVAATNTHAPFTVTHTRYEPVPIVVFNAGPGPRSEAVLAKVELPSSLRNAVVVDEQGTHMPYYVVSSNKYEIGRRHMDREMLAAVIALAELSTPGQFVRMAHNMIMSVLGRPEDQQETTHIQILPAQESGLVRVEFTLAPRGRVTVDTDELHAAEAQLLQLFSREDIQMIEIAVMEQAQEIIDFVAHDLPAYGLKTFWLYPYGLREEPPPTPSSSLTTHPNSIENEFYRVEANTQDGTLTITDKETDAVFSGLNRFVDGGDVGDLYTYCPPAQDTLIGSPVAPPRIEVANPGPIRAVLRISGDWELPAACSEERTTRDSHTTLCPITSEITLTPGVHRVDIRTTVQNTAKDHRLRAVFPVSYRVERVAAEGTFEVRARPVATPLPENVGEWVERPVNAFPQKRFVDISDGNVGLGILNQGLPECEVVQSGPGLEPGQMAVALTLLRCVDWLSRGDLSTRQGHAGPMSFTPEAQCLGTRTFAYALVPHRGDWDAQEARVQREAQAFNLPVRSVISDQHAGQLPPLATLVEVEPRGLVVSAIKRSNTEQGLIVRVYNPFGRSLQATIRPGVACEHAFVANLLEEPQEQLIWSGNTHNEQVEPLHVEIRAGEITTLLFQ